jgi:cytochrome b subunit of formate dehydrogenase/nitrate/TMAO reductase-like tetraheme cytochrome c subunit
MPPGAWVHAADDADEGWTDEGCLECHEFEDLTMEDENGNEVSIYVDEKKMRETAHGKVACADCHVDLSTEHPDDEIPAKPVSCVSCHEEQSHTFGTSVHGIALQAGNDAAPTCVDCHGAHDVFPHGSERSLMHHTRLATTCGSCHIIEAEELAESVHGAAAAAGERDAANCIDCHSEHKIRSLEGGAASSMVAEACSKCHSSERINSRLGLTANPVETFYASYHGLATEGGSTTAANCASCHGYHLILPSDNPESLIHPTQLTHTCGRCHPGAGENFVVGKIHADQSDHELGSLVNHWARRIYLVLIVTTISVLCLHNGIIWWRKAVAARKARGETVLRMDRNQRFQHLVLLTSFIVLAVTGFALKFPDTWYAGLMGSEETRRWIHRISGLVLLGIGAYHLAYLLACRNGRRLFRDMWPRWRDVRDVGATIRHLVRGGPMPRIGRFGYAEKFEYWAVVWGTVIMGVTGLAIWFKIDVTRWVPRWVIEVAITIHYYEAILACLAIVVWHFYHVIFDPDVYPMNWAWLDGKVSKSPCHDEHAPVAEEAKRPDAPAVKTPPRGAGT